MGKRGNRHNAALRESIFNARSKEHTALKMLRRAQRNLDAAQINLKLREEALVEASRERLFREIYARKELP